MHICETKPYKTFSRMPTNITAALIEYFCLYTLAAAKKFYLSFITNKTRRISFKSGCAVLVAKHLKEDWFIVLR